MKLIVFDGQCNTVTGTCLKQLKANTFTILWSVTVINCVSRIARLRMVMKSLKYLGQATVKYMVKVEDKYTETEK